MQNKGVNIPWKIITDFSAIMSVNISPATRFQIAATSTVCFAIAHYIPTTVNATVISIILKTKALKIVQIATYPICRNITIQSF